MQTPSSTTPRPLAGAPDFAAIKVKQQAAWSSGGYGNIGARIQIVGETLCEAVDLRAGEKVLDVAAGNGNASLAAARCFAEVTSTDYVPTLLSLAQDRAEADHLEIRFEVADAEKLPFQSGTFDVALSTFGVMFAPDQDQAAAELLRVVRPGGRIGLANWTPEGFVGQLFKVVGSFVPPAAGLRSPLAWGTEARLQELFGADARGIHAQRRTYTFRFRSEDHWIDYFRTYYGPMHKAFLALDPQGQVDFREALKSLARAWNRSDRGDFLVPSEYLEIVVTK